MELNKQQIEWIVIGLVFISVGILGYGMYQLGAYQMCLGSDGVLLGDGHCVNYSSLNYCVGESDGYVKSYPEIRGFVVNTD